MQSGALRHRVTLQSQQVARDSAGGEVITWVDYATRWAEVRASSAAREGFIPSANQVQAVAPYRIRMRAISPLPTVKDRAIWQTYTYDIQNVIDPDGRGAEIHLICEAVI